jgi:peptidyl-dipeptidase A
MMPEALADFVARAVAQVESLETRANQAYWDLTTTGKPEYEAEYVRLQMALRRVLADAEAFASFRSLFDIDRPAADPLVARQATLLYYQFAGNQMDESTIQELTQREAAIENEFVTYRADLNGHKTADNELKEILRDSEDVNLRREAWEASKQIGRRVADRLLELVELRNRIARDSGFADFYAMRLELQELDEIELFNLFDELDRYVSPLYGAYKADLDARLSVRFGVPVADLRPWHYSDPFFQEAPAADPAVRELLNRTYADQDLVALMRRFYHALNLEIDDVLARSDLYERAGKQQHAYCVHIDRRGDVRTLCNVRSSHYWMSTLLHEFGHAVYDKYLDVGLPYLLRQPAHTLMTEAVALMMGRLASDAVWIDTYVTPNGGAAALAPLLRQFGAAESLIMSRWVPVMCHFERALYRNPTQDLNRLWWDLEERFQGVPRPEGRDEPDWAAKIHLSTAPVYYHNYLLGELIASQLRRAINANVLTGYSDPGRGFVTDPAVGGFLVDRVFRQGAQRHWQAALEYATGERLQPRYFVDDVSVQ